MYAKKDAYLAGRIDARSYNCWVSCERYIHAPLGLWHACGCAVAELFMDLTIIMAYTPYLVKPKTCTCTS